jgi:hypothetical protein
MRWIGSLWDQYFQLTKSAGPWAAKFWTRGPCCGHCSNATHDSNLPARQGIVWSNRWVTEPSFAWYRGAKDTHNDRHRVDENTVGLCYRYSRDKGKSFLTTLTLSFKRYSSFRVMSEDKRIGNKELIRLSAPNRVAI